MQKLAAATEKRYLLGPVATRFGAAKTGTWRIDRPVFEQEKCTACMLCKKFCPADLVTVDKADKNVTFDFDYCKGCGICMTSCARGCITMQPERNFV
jgi:2-oxoacid:acceptor oxidoreductase delta subunit (pyruvate/2-ketoisovalerate family)